MKILSVFGTRPEAIKMCPLVAELEKTPGFESRVCLSGQHREMLEQVMAVFGTRVDWNLDIMRSVQALPTMTGDVLTKLDPLLEREQPDLVLVQGDTTTSFAAALAAFYRKIPIGHVEAGLRTGDRYSPYPEEINRTLISRLATLHFAPTQSNAQNLRQEGIRERVYVTGNTVIDAFAYTVRKDYRFECEALRDLDWTGKRLVMLTAHRRENWGAPLHSIFQAIRSLHNRFDDIRIVYPVHLNPLVSAPARELLGELERVVLLPPLSVRDMHNLLSISTLVLTDSGVLQEEAPAFGVPVLVLRAETEWPEAVEAGTARVVGTGTDNIVREASWLLSNTLAHAEMARAVNPYGDGHACERIVQHIVQWKEEKQRVLQHSTSGRSLPEGARLSK